MLDQIRDIRAKVYAFQDEALSILSKQAGHKNRVHTLDGTRRALSGLSLRQDALFAQAISCIEHSLFRASYVMAWAGFVDVVEEMLASDGLVKVRQMRPNWTKWATIEELRENVPEQQLLEVARDLRLFSKAESKVVFGLLAARNECAHPSGNDPGLDESLGYVADLLKRISALRSKTL